MIQSGRHKSELTVNFSLAMASTLGVLLLEGFQGDGLMSRRNAGSATHPFAIPLFGAAAACAFGSLYWLVGIGATPLHGALTFAILYGSIIAVVFGLMGIVWCTVKLLALHAQNFAGQNEDIASAARSARRSSKQQR